MSGKGGIYGFVEHIRELRRRLLYCVIGVMLVFMSLFYFSNDLYEILSKPLISSFAGKDSTMIATDVAAPLFIPIKFTLILSVFITIPFILYQVWAFIVPGLLPKERVLIWPLLVSSTLLFYIGILFSYFIVFPVVFGFLTNTAPDGVMVMPDISKYLGFALKLFFAFGFSFEVPVFVFLIIKAGLSTVESLSSKRRYIIVVAFVMGMLLTPPDVVSQIMLAIPIWLLFESGLFCAKVFIKTPELQYESTL